MNSIVNSFRREARRLAADPWDLAMVTWVPLLAVALLWWIFSAGLPRHLPVGVVDEDHSSLSRQLVRMLDATPGVRIAQNHANAAEAERALRALEVYAVVTIPRDFARTVKEGRAAQVTLLHNAQMGTHSGLLQRDVRAAVGTLSAGIEMAARNKRGESAQAMRVSMEPIHTQLVALFNVSSNYEQFLGAALIPALLHILAMTAGAWTVGRELRDRSLGEWLGTGRFVPVAGALLGKLVLPWATLTLVGLLALAGITWGRGWHPPGSLPWVAAALALLMAVSVAAGAALAALTRSLRTALSGAGFFAAPAFAFSGVAFPLAGMPASARAWAEAMPFTHYIRLQIEQLQMGAPLATSVSTMAALLIATGVLWLVAAMGLSLAAGQPASWGGR
ncbi:MULTISPECIES: ABC transporter permease [unclassified Acidovorax]|uniref:ABC transporter permease n=1 Tax=unclassified Acidovorax TaxID=2684926 RepID=UPI001C450484|nr:MULTISPECIES: ABC transporter permease [unclassified Acidovorax]MBV7431220.1 ABC transporter permease [Acidovorax sp. sif0732]MBV7452326.1 ABC transporter permease [Acidovorax sp. sif0715]